MTLSLFALMNNPENRIVRFVLSEEVWHELTPFFKAQEEEFRASVQQEIQFDGKYKPDFGEVLVILGYDDIDSLNQAIKNPLAIPEVDPTEATFASIKALFTGYIDEKDEVKILIQHFDRRKIISTNGLSIFHAANVYKKIEGIGITIDSKLSAILEGGNLKFYSFHLLRQIFDLSEYYKEATDSDITEFASLKLIKAHNLPELIALSDSWIRRKVSLIQQSEILESVSINDIKAVALEFAISIETVVADGVERIALPSNKAALKTLLRFLDEDYYKSPLSQKQYITNSKRVAPSNRKQVTH